MSETTNTNSTEETLIEESSGVQEVKLPDYLGTVTSITKGDTDDSYDSDAMYQNVKIQSTSSSTDDNVTEGDEYLGSGLAISSVMNPVIQYDSSMTETDDNNRPYFIPSKVKSDTLVHSVIYGYISFNIDESGLCCNGNYSGKTFQYLVENKSLNKLKIQVNVDAPGYDTMYLEKTISDISGYYDSNNKSYDLGLFYIPIPIITLSNILDATKLIGSELGREIGSIVDLTGSGTPFGSAVNINSGPDTYYNGTIFSNPGPENIWYPTNTSVYTCYASTYIDPGRGVKINDIIKDNVSQYASDYSAYDVVNEYLADMGEVKIKVLVTAPDLNNNSIFAYQYNVSNAALGGDISSTEYSTCDHTDKTLVSSQSATCTEAGYLEYTCNYCGKVIKEIIPPTGHTVSYKYYVRSSSGIYVEKTESEYNSATTCKYIKSVCSECGDVINECYEEYHPESSMISHEAKEANCEVNGHTAYTECGVCGKTFGYSSTNPLGHDWEIEIIQPEGHGHNPGGKKYTCKRCGTINMVWDGEVQHTWDLIENVSATCEDAGYMKYKCHYCKETKTEIEALGHSLIIIPGKEATCTKDGYTEYTRCIRCGDVKERTKISALGHDWETIEAKEATCTEDGNTGGKRCKRCGEQTDGAVIKAKGHQWVQIGYKAATNTEDGTSGTQVCEVCGATNPDYQTVTFNRLLSSPIADTAGPSVVINQSGDHKTAALSMADGTGQLFDTSGSGETQFIENSLLTWDQLLSALAFNQNINLLGEKLNELKAALGKYAANPNMRFIITTDANNDITISVLTYGPGIKFTNFSDGQGRINAVGIKTNLTTGPGIKINSEADNVQKFYLKLTPGTNIAITSKGDQPGDEVEISSDIQEGNGVTIGEDGKLNLNIGSSSALISVTSNGSKYTIGTKLHGGTGVEIDEDQAINSLLNAGHGIRMSNNKIYANLGGDWRSISPDHNYNTDYILPRSDTSNSQYWCGGYGISDGTATEEDNNLKRDIRPKMKILPLSKNDHGVITSALMMVYADYPSNLRFSYYTTGGGKDGLIDTTNDAGSWLCRFALNKSKINCSSYTSLSVLSGLWHTRLHRIKGGVTLHQGVMTGYTTCELEDTDNYGNSVFIVRVKELVDGFEHSQQLGNDNANYTLKGDGSKHHSGRIEFCTFGLLY